MGRLTRVHYMDNLRAFAMLLGVFFHAALAYSPMLGNLYMTADPQQSQVVDWLAWFSHTFRMPLFFIVAGFFGAMMLEKRGHMGLFKNRVLRVVTPFAIFLPIVWAAFAMIIGWAMESVQNPSPMLGLINMMAQSPDAPAPPVTTTHLWFLYQLIFFYAIALVITRFSQLAWLAKIAKSPRLFLLVAPLLLVPALMTQHAPLPAPEQFMPQLWSFGFYGLFFAFGWGLFSHQQLLVQLKSYMAGLLVVGVGLYALFFLMLPKTVSMQEVMTQASQTPELSWMHLLKATMEAYISVFMCLGLLVLGLRFLDKQSAMVRYIADSSYWVYIIHLPLLWLIQFYLLDTSWGLVTEFLISSLGTIVIGMVSYAILVRYTPIGWLLNGKRSGAKNESAKEAN